jgi:hypothetical protein
MDALKRMRTCVDTTQPNIPQTIGRNYKRFENEQQRNETIMRDNGRLLGKMTDIQRMEHYPRAVPQRPYTLMGSAQKDEMSRITHENHKLLTAVQERRPILNRNDWLAHRLDHQYQITKMSEYKRTVPMGEIIRQEQIRTSHGTPHALEPPPRPLPGYQDAGDDLGDPMRDVIDQSNLGDGQHPEEGPGGPTRDAAAPDKSHTSTGSQADPKKPGPSAPTRPAQPVKPAKPAEPSKPARPSKTAKPGPPAKPAEPSKPAKPVEPAGPPQSVTPEEEQIGDVIGSTLDPGGQEPQGEPADRPIGDVIGSTISGAAAEEEEPPVLAGVIGSTIAGADDTPPAQPQGGGLGDIIGSALANGDDAPPEQPQGGGLGDIIGSTLGGGKGGNEQQAGGGEGLGDIMGGILERGLQ